MLLSTMFSKVVIDALVFRVYLFDSNLSWNDRTVDRIILMKSRRAALDVKAF